MDNIATRLSMVRDRVQSAAAAAGRSELPAIVAVSKTVGPDAILEAYRAGQLVFGENRVLEGADKVSALAPVMQDAHWHFIGHLQTNKVRLAAEAFDLIESVDSLRLARKLDEAAERRGIRLPVLIEVNVVGEPSKSGFHPADLEMAVPVLANLPHLHLRGLMTVAPLVGDPEEARPAFRGLRELCAAIQDAAGLQAFCELSMGMTNDFEVAVSEGATMIRLGRAIFGERPGVRGTDAL